MAEAVVEAARPFAACAYENTGGAGATSPFGLDGVELIVKYTSDINGKVSVRLAGIEILVFTKYPKFSALEGDFKSPQPRCPERFV